MSYELHSSGSVLGRAEGRRKLEATGSGGDRLVPSPPCPNSQVRLTSSPTFLVCPLLHLP